MQSQGPENTYARMPFIEKLLEMGWKKEQIIYQPEWQVPATLSEASKLEQIDFEFYKKHVRYFKEINNPSLNKHLRKIEL